MNIRSRQVIWSVSLVLALVAGFGIGRYTESQPAADRYTDLTDRHPAEAQESEHAGSDEDLVALKPEQISASGIGTVLVTRGGAGQIRLAGRVEATINARATVQAPVDGSVEQVLVSSGSEVVAGEVLAVILSGDAALIRANDDAARAEAHAARLVHERNQALVAQGVVARQELEASHARLLALRAAEQAAGIRAKAAGSPDAAGRIKIKTPVAGLVTSVQLTPGGVVAAGDPVASVVDPAQTELVFTVPPSVAADVKAGMRIAVTAGQTGFPAEVIGVATELREQGARAVIRARAEPGLLPAIGSPVSGDLILDGNADTLMVPTEAVQTVEGRSVVFVADAAGFRARPVRLGRQARGQIEILGGLSGDEQVVATQAFLLKAELAKGEAGHAH